MGPVDLASNVVLLQIIAGLSFQLRIVGEIERECLEGIWHHGVYCFIESGGRN